MSWSNERIGFRAGDCSIHICKRRKKNRCVPFFGYTRASLVDVVPLASNSFLFPVTGFGLGGSAASNYSVNTTATTLAVITARGLINGAWFQLSIGGNIYSVQSQAEVRDGIIHINFRMTAELKAILAAATTATSGKGYLCF